MYWRNGVTTTEVAVTPPTSPRWGRKLERKNPIQPLQKIRFWQKFQAAFFLKNLVDFLEAWGVCWQLVPVQPSRVLKKEKRG